MMSLTQMLAEPSELRQHVRMNLRILILGISIMSGWTHQVSASESCVRHLKSVTPAYYREALIAVYGRNSLARAAQWMERFPVCVTGVEGVSPQSIHLKDAWLEFLMAVSQPEAEKRGLQLFRSENVSPPYLMLAPHYWKGWRELGLINQAGDFQFSLGLFEMASRFRKAMRKAQFPLEVFFPKRRELHWRGNFLSSQEFAVSILKGAVPIDDLHAIFFHLPDLLDPTRRKYFLWSVRFLELEQLYREIKKVPDSSALGISERLFHDNFEGKDWPDPMTLSGYIQLMNPHFRGVEPRPSWSALDWEALSSQSSEDFIAALQQKGFPRPQPDHSHWKLILPAVRKVLGFYRADLGSSAEFFYSRDQSFDVLYRTFLEETDTLLQQL